MAVADDWPGRRRDRLGGLLRGGWLEASQQKEKRKKLQRGFHG
jgi:hypothetical protein